MSEHQTRYLSIPYQNAKCTPYPAWRVWLVHILAKPLGVLVHVDGYPFGSNRIRRRNDTIKRAAYLAIGEQRE